MTKRTIAVDFDGVIHSYTSGWQGPWTIPDEPVPGAIEFLGDMLVAGWDVVIVSARARYPFAHAAMRGWLKRHAGMLWYDNMAGPGIEAVRISAYKQPAHVMIDDRVLRFEGRFPSHEELSAFAPWTSDTKG